MKIGYMTNAFGPLVGAGGGVTSVKDIRYVTMTDDEATLEQITKIGFKSIEVLEGNLTNYADDSQVLIDMLAKYGADMIPSLTVAEIKNRCIPCVYWGTAIFVVVMKYSNLFFSFAFFLDRSHFAFGYELIISSEAAGFMKIICNGFTLI